MSYKKKTSEMKDTKEIKEQIMKEVIHKLPIKYGILTISDSCANGDKTDESGPALQAIINKDKDANQFKGKVYYTAIVPDNKSAITQKLIDWSDGHKADVIFTTGGTGFSKRDNTPEATKSIIQKEIPGMSFAMLMLNLKATPLAMLSRSVCGIRNKTLIINLPGSVKGATECLNVIASTIPHAVDLLQDNKEAVKDVHDSMQDKAMLCAQMPNLNMNVTTRQRESIFPMISVDEALKIMFDHATIISEIETVNIKDVYNRTLAMTMYSKVDLPSFRASVKDGYAILASDGKGKRKVLCGVKAGSLSVPVHLTPGTCVRVNTGAPIPDEATAVVQVEDTKLVSKTSDGMEEEEIEIMIDEIVEGQDIRAIGSDIAKGDLILYPTRIGPVEMGLLAACGYKEIQVVKLPSIGVLSTGDELQEPGEIPKPGHVYDSNRITLIAFLHESGYNAEDFGIVIDEEVLMVEKIKTILEKVDILVTTGSVSMGDRDMLKSILQKHFNADIHFGRVNMKPGKPTTFATCKYLGKKKYFVCLPGNPLSAVVAARLFVIPFLNYMQDFIINPIVIQAKLSSTYYLDSRPEYVNVTLKWEQGQSFPVAYNMGNQKSSRLFNCKDGNGLLLLPARSEEKEVLTEGDIALVQLTSCK